MDNRLGHGIGHSSQKCATNVSVYERCGIGPCANGVKCGVVE